MERTWKHTLFACIAAAVLVATLLLVGGKLIEKTSDTPAGTQQTEENTQQQEQTYRHDRCRAAGSIPNRPRAGGPS